MTEAMARLKQLACDLEARGDTAGAMQAAAILVDLEAVCGRIPSAGEILERSVCRICDGTGFVSATVRGYECSAPCPKCARQNRRQRRRKMPPCPADRRTLAAGGDR